MKRSFKKTTTKYKHTHKNTKKQDRQEKKQIEEIFKKGENYSTHVYMHKYNLHVCTSCSYQIVYAQKQALYPSNCLWRENENKQETEVKFILQYSMDEISNN